MKLSKAVLSVLLVVFLCSRCSDEKGSAPEGSGRTVQPPAGPKKPQKKAGDDTSSRPNRDVIFVLPTAANEIKVATYNVLNLFDTEHDAGKEDHTFLPMGTAGKKEGCQRVTNPYYRKQCLETDWTESKLRLKLNQIKKALSAQGSLPDILAVQEIENERVTRRLAQTLGYTRFFVTNSPDKRGIDVAILFREDKLTYLEHDEIVLQGAGFPQSFVDKPTRNILRVHFKVKNANDEVLGIYANHWPSQAAKPDKRVIVANKLKEVLDTQFRNQGNKYHVVLLGDFNTLPQEKVNAFHNVLQKPGWAHQMLDVQALAKRARIPELRDMPLYSYWYTRNNRWEKLDRILVSQNLKDNAGIEVLPASFRIVAASFMLEPFEYTYKNSFHFGTKLAAVPHRYDFTTTDKSKLGYSDHLPMIVKIKIK